MLIVQHQPPSVSRQFLKCSAIATASLVVIAAQAIGLIDPPANGERSTPPASSTTTEAPAVQPAQELKLEAK